MSDGDFEDSANGRPASNILWDATREYLRDSQPAHRALLDEVLLAGSYEVFYLGQSHYCNQVLDEFLLQDLEWIFAVSHAAILYGDICSAGRTAQSETIGELQEEFEYACRQAISHLLELKGCRQPFQTVACESIAQISSAADRISAWVTQVSHAMSREPEWLEEHRARAIHALVEFESTIRWLTDSGKSQRKSSAGYVVFASRDSRERSGSLAKLEIRQYELPEITPILDRPAIVHAPVYRGMTTTDSEWDHAFHQAALWGMQFVDGENEIPQVYLYDLNFRFVSRENELNDLFARPLSIRGPSASLAAGVLVRSLHTNTSLDANVCYVGAVASADGNLSEVDGVVSKDTALDSCRFNGTLVVGPISNQAKSEMRAWGLFQGDEQLIRVEQPTHAFDISSGKLAAIEALIRSEQRNALAHIGRFVPARVFQAFEGGGRDLERELDQLESISVSQKARSTQKRSRSSASRDTTGERNPAGKRQPLGASEDLVTVIDDFVIGPSKSACLKILGKPGSGKTWASLRCHFRQLSKFLKDHKSGTWLGRGHRLTVWTTFRELQRHLKDKSDALVTIKKIVIGRLTVEARDQHGQQINELIESIFSSGRIVLIVDSWDERNRDTEDIEVSIESFLRSWKAKNGLLLTSRPFANDSTEIDSLAVLDRSPAWLIEEGQSERGVLQFAQRWFGRTYDDFENRITEIAGTPAFLELTANPQLAAIICALIEERHLPDASIVNASQLLRHSVLELIVKRNDDTKSRDLLLILEELAFRTFNGKRWEFTLRDLECELSKPAYEHLRDDREQYARAILESGLFQCQASDGIFPVYSVIHQCFVELLAGSRMARLFPEYEGSPDKIAQRLGWFLPQWHQPFRHFIRLSRNGSPILELLEGLRVDNAWDTTIRDCVMACLEHGLFPDSNPDQLSRFQEICDAALTQDYEYEDYAIPNDLDTIRTLVTNLTSQGLATQYSERYLDKPVPAIERLAFARKSGITVCESELPGIFEGAALLESSAEEAFLILDQTLESLPESDQEQLLEQVCRSLDKSADEWFDPNTDILLGELSPETIPIRYRLAKRLVDLAFDSVACQFKNALTSDSDSSLRTFDGEALPLGNCLIVASQLAISAFEYSQDLDRLSEIHCEMLPQMVDIADALAKTCSTWSKYTRPLQNGELDQRSVDANAVWSNMLTGTKKSKVWQIWAHHFWHDLCSTSDPDSVDAHNLWNSLVDLQRIIGKWLLNDEVTSCIKRELDWVEWCLDHNEPDSEFLANTSVHWSTEAEARFAVPAKSNLPYIPRRLFRSQLDGAEMALIVHLAFFHMSVNVLRQLPSRSCGHDQTALCRLFRWLVNKFEYRAWARLKRICPDIESLEEQVRSKISLELHKNIEPLLICSRRHDAASIAEKIRSAEAFVEQCMPSGKSWVTNYLTAEDRIWGHWQLSETFTQHHRLERRSDGMYVHSGSASLSEHYEASACETPPQALQERWVDSRVVRDFRWLVKLGTVLSRRD